MARIEDILVPDIGEFDAVEVIEVLVKSGDIVSAEDPLLTMESDKASMDVPSPFGGTVKAVKIKAGDRVSQNDLILTIMVVEESENVVPETAAKTALSEATAPKTEDSVSADKPDSASHEPAPSDSVRRPLDVLLFQAGQEQRNAAAGIGRRLSGVRRPDRSGRRGGSGRGVRGCLVPARGGCRRWWSARGGGPGQSRVPDRPSQ